jgi:hypothetical protein
MDDIEYEVVIEAAKAPYIGAVYSKKKVEAEKIASKDDDKEEAVEEVREEAWGEVRTDSSLSSKWVYLVIPLILIIMIALAAGFVLGKMS